MKTLDSILDDMTTRVKENQPVSASNWLDAAIKINALKGDLDNEIADYEGELIMAESLLIGEGKSQSAARTLCRANIGYKDYLRAKAKAKRIEEFLRLAKKRSMVEEFN